MNSARPTKASISTPRRSRAFGQAIALKSNNADYYYGRCVSFSYLGKFHKRAIRSMAMRAFDIVGCTGWGRLDLILRSDGTFTFLEVNTSPGMTPHSLVPMAAKQSGMSFPDLCVEILRGAHVG